MRWLSSAGASASTPPTSSRARSAARGHLGLGDAGLAVDAQPHAHLPVGHGEQRRGRPGHGAAGERHPEGPGAVVGPPGDPLDPVEVVAGLGGSAGHLEHHEVARDTTPLVNFLS